MNRLLLTLSFFITSATLCAAEQTLAIIKPDAVASHHVGEVIHRFERAQLDVTALKMVTLSKKDAATFYAVHNEQPFFSDLVQFMSSGPIVVMAIEGQDAVSKTRELIGSTDPNSAATGTLRSDYGSAINRNAMHGSDSSESGRKEVAFFFKPSEIQKPTTSS